MALSFIEQRKLLLTGNFRERVIPAITAAAIAIQFENSTPDAPAGRKSLARSVITNPAGMEPQFSLLVATLLTTADPTDEAISGAVSSVWNALSDALYPE